MSFNGPIKYLLFVLFPLFAMQSRIQIVFYKTLSYAEAAGWQVEIAPQRRTVKARK